MTLINNKVRLTKSENRYIYGNKFCKPGSIMAPFDGDDTLIGRQVFSLVNAIYQKRNPLFLYFNHFRLNRYDPDQVWRYHIGWCIDTP